MCEMFIDISLSGMCHVTVWWISKLCYEVKNTPEILFINSYKIAWLLLLSCVYWHCYDLLILNSIAYFILQT